MPPLEAREMLVGPHPALLSASEWRSEEDLPRPFSPGWLAAAERVV